MDDLLKLVADAGLQASIAEEALEAGEHQRARDALDVADDVLSDLRTRWPDMAAGDRAIVGRTAQVVRRRLDAARLQVPRASALTQAPMVVDPEQEVEPEVAPT